MEATAGGRSPESTLLDLDPTNLYQIPQEYDHRHVTLKKQEPLKNELKDFLEAAEKGRRPLANGEDGIEALRTADEPQLV